MVGECGSRAFFIFNSHLTPFTELSNGYVVYVFTLAGQGYWTDLTGMSVCTVKSLQHER